MFFSKNILGMEISPTSVTCALLGGKQALPRLERISSRPLNSGILRVSLRDPNIIEPNSFAEKVREAHALLLDQTNQVSVTLPDAVGRILMLDVEGRFKNKSEALDIIRWKLKKNMPFDVADTHLDYQILRMRENGDMSLLVALVSRPVIEQYEESFISAGLIPVGIDLNTFSLCRAFQKHLELFEDVILISFYGSTLGVVVIYEGSPEFIRVKDLSSASAIDSRVFMEINSSLLVWQERFPERTVQKVVCIAAPDVATNFCDMVAEAVNTEPVIMEIKSSIKPSDNVPADQVSLFPFSAAIGAAMRSL
ncbi:type IV pilus biogenesis protein PilM [Pelotalea chapellei]|uniref:Pilus assembly protein PilM n=1 Tax=Pelotalea chapellei TaxID=44671 RepID=A0ABS5U704_9BACT|nr:pilus assembly protein PilM [Pelotalea chapellei]MBT1071434.1 pilus assembly protein PilM [Pelotalea chapellei]